MTKLQAELIKQQMMYLDLLQKCNKTLEKINMTMDFDTSTLEKKREQVAVAAALGLIDFDTDAGWEQDV